MHAEARNQVPPVTFTSKTFQLGFEFFIIIKFISILVLWESDYITSDIHQHC